MFTACAALKGSENYTFKFEEKLGDVYALAITDGYQYMFTSSKGFALNGKDVGMFEGGFQGLFLYSDFKEALIEYYGIKEDPSVEASYYNLSIYRQWVDMDLFVTTEQSYQGFKRVSPEQQFHHYNPELVVWAANNMIPAPEDMIGDRTAQEVYDNVMQRFFRLMTEMYWYLEQNDPDKQIEEYMVEVNKPKKERWGYGAMNYLTERYDPLFTQYGTSDGTRFTAGMAIGFWMRRSMDGTMDEFWEALKKTMKTYDSEWFKG